MTPGDADIAEIQLRALATPEQDDSLELSMKVTTSHSILVTTGKADCSEWAARQASELQPNRHKLFARGT